MIISIVDKVEKGENMLTKREFDLLVLLSGQSNPITQRQMAEKLNCSLGTINKLRKELVSKGYYDGIKVTLAGLEALEPYRVKRAVFIAAGFGSRLVPVTLNTPKPLVRVNGVRMIDTLLDAVVRAGIPEIVIVRGYLGEQFDQLRYKYPQIQFVENPLFNESNNISSAMCVRHLFANAYVLDSDLILKNPDLIRTYEYESNLLGIPVERTDDWCITADKNGMVDSVAVGGVHAYREVGIFYWDAKDGANLADDLQDVYQSPGGKERLWEQVPLLYKKEHYQVKVRKCCEKDVLEIDTFAELKQQDNTYKI